ncbi:MAG TPA: undecaprenyl-diphosphate phosphatase [Candidatus Binataceae bacterium]|jgi:undecaprenyl-diphosphatase
MLSFLQAAILGILQGISELFPISSLGHSILLPHILGWNIDQNANYFLSFLVATHFATAVVLFFFYWSDWMRIISGILRSVRLRKIASDPDATLGWLLVVGTVPAGIIGVLFQKKVQELFTAPLYVAAFLTLNGVLLLIADLLRKRSKRRAGVLDADERLAAELSWRQSTGVGVMQVLALLPGFSRTGSTIAGGLMVGLAHEDALRFSFLLATPIIAAAAALKLPILIASRNGRAIETALLGAACAAIAAYFSVKFLTKYFKTRTLLPFAIYCLLTGAVTMALLSFK